MLATCPTGHPVSGKWRLAGVPSVSGDLTAPARTRANQVIVADRRGAGRWGAFRAARGATEPALATSRPRVPVGAQASLSAAAGAALLTPARELLLRSEIVISFAAGTADNNGVDLGSAALRMRVGTSVRIEVAQGR